MPVIKDDMKELSDIQNIIISFMSKNDKITIPELTRKVGSSESTISREIKTLRDDLNILKRADVRKDGIYTTCFFAGIPKNKLILHQL